MGHKLDPYKGIIEARLEEFPRLSAKRLYDEVQAAGYTGGYGRVQPVDGGGADADQSLAYLAAHRQLPVPLQRLQHPGKRRRQTLAAHIVQHPPQLHEFPLSGTFLF